jgi:ubiquinone/menaquinone biosynthesis C-methylase UbiE
MSLRSPDIRVHETEVGLQGDELALKYDHMQRHIRDRGWLQEKVDNIIDDAGIVEGHALEIGCGPGYLGLEWLTQAAGDATLVGLDIADSMIGRARANARTYGLADRATYEIGNVLAVPHDDATFDHVFSTSSFHEWVEPVTGLREINRVLRPGGRYCVTDLRRDLDRTTLQFMKANIAADMRPGFRTSVKSAYTTSEARALLVDAGLTDAQVVEVAMGLVIFGTRQER